VEISLSSGESSHPALRKSTTDCVGTGALARPGRAKVGKVLVLRIDADSFAPSGLYLFLVVPKARALGSSLAPLRG
jgi:hypothetical protein